MENTLDPKVAQVIAESEAGKSFITFLAGCAFELDSISGIDLTDPNELAIEVKARQRAKEKFEKVLGSLLASPNASTIKDARDSFAVEIDSPQVKKD